MHKLFILLLFLNLTLEAREEAVAYKACAAFNNMKHTKNTHNVSLNTSSNYTILRHHKGQVLLLIQGEQPAQRWVDESCFQHKEASLEAVNQSISAMLYTHKKPLIKKDTKKDQISKNNLLALSWHNAFCETHRYKKECKRPRFPLSKKPYSENRFVLHGLWPQPKNRHYCQVGSRVKNLDKYKKWHKLPEVDLSENVQKELSSVMPGFASNLHKHQWVKHGSCYGTSANQYFKDAVSLVKQVNDSNIGKFFQQNVGKRITLQQIRTLFNRTFGAGAGNRVELRCKSGLISELWLHLGGGSADIGTLLKVGKVTRSRCQSGFLDKAGF